MSDLEHAVAARRWWRRHWRRRCEYVVVAFRHDDRSKILLVLLFFVFVLYLTLVVQLDPKFKRKKRLVDREAQHIAVHSYWHTSANIVATLRAKNNKHKNIFDRSDIGV